jgi:hypothetical protein
MPLDSGSVSFTVDEKTVAVTPEGSVELTLEIGLAYVLAASGLSHGAALRAEMTFTPTAEHEGKSVTLHLVRA